MVDRGRSELGPALQEVYERARARFGALAEVGRRRWPELRRDLEVAWEDLREAWGREADEPGAGGAGGASGAGGARGAAPGSQAGPSPAGPTPGGATAGGGASGGADAGSEGVGRAD